MSSKPGPLTLDYKVLFSLAIVIAILVIFIVIVAIWSNFPPHFDQSPPSPSAVATDTPTVQGEASNLPTATFIPPPLTRTFTSTISPTTQTDTPSATLTSTATPTLTQTSTLVPTAIWHWSKGCNRDSQFIESYAFNRSRGIISIYGIAGRIFDGADDAYELSYRKFSSTDFKIIQPNKHSQGAFAVNWDISNLPFGDYELQLRVYDSKGINLNAYPCIFSAIAIN